MPTRPAIAIALIVLIGYGATRAWPLLAGPTITFASPENHQALPDGRVSLTGTAKHTENLWLDGAPLLIDESGHFSTSLVLPQGGAILSVTATDRFGHEITERRTVFVP